MQFNVMIALLNTPIDIENAMHIHLKDENLYNNNK